MNDHDRTPPDPDEGTRAGNVDDDELIEFLSSLLAEIADLEPGPRHQGRPERWWDTPTWRCTRGHVSTTVLRSEGLGRDACLAGGCTAPVTLTFPEDRDGPLLVPKR